MKGWPLALALAVLPLVAAAEVRFGDLDPEPEVLKVFDDRMRMGARLVFSGSEDLALDVTQARKIDLQMGFITSADAVADDVRLRCVVRWVSPDGILSEPVRDVVCFEGNLGDVAGQWVPMSLDLTFRPDPDDAPGNTGVQVIVTEELTGTEVYFVPSFFWRAGKG